MIGVFANLEEESIVREFFELFKTPWEFHRPGHAYDVVVCTRNECPQDHPARLVLFYNSDHPASDTANKIQVQPGSATATFSYAGHQMPIYGQVATFPSNPLSLPREGGVSESLLFLSKTDKGSVVRIGCDLFKETRMLLMTGQPIGNAKSPTLELHIALLRDLITRSGIPLVEIPPIPAEYGFIACLTHDLDHPVIRNHWIDHTMFGFLYRATVGSALEFFRGRRAFKNLCRNWLAAVRLPFVYLGMAKDTWRAFEHYYLQMEAGLGATYFVIPRKNYAGRKIDDAAQAKRAAGYEIADIKPELLRIQSQGNEVALHGIDAWMETASGRSEQGILSRTLGFTEAPGIRMHWLCFDSDSPTILEAAGFSYDSSVGYNETVGYRAGTTQAYIPPGADKLVELPLHVMDTALFSSQFLNLSEADAKRTVGEIIADLAQFGGALTINWHDRSIVPERLWDGFYLELIGELKNRKAWFPTAAQAVAWFRKRRSVSFGLVQCDTRRVTFSASADPDTKSPALRVRVHKPGTWEQFNQASAKPAGYVDVIFSDKIETSVALT